MAFPEAAPPRGGRSRRLAARLRGFPVRVARAERRLLAAILVTALSLLAFALVARAVMEGATRGFDEALLLAFRSTSDRSDPLGPLWAEEMVRDVTALGGTAVLALVTLAVLGFLLMTGRRHAALFIAVAVVGGMLVSLGLKWGFARPRPDLVPHGTRIHTESFPSSHAMLSAVVYLTLGTLLARTQRRWRVRVYLLLLAAAITVGVGASRVYLGVHWPTDVLAGWALGAAWALLCWLAMLRLQRRGQVETPGREG